MMSSTKLFSYPGRMYSISVFVKSNFLSVLQWLWSPNCPQGGILFSCADTFLQEIWKSNHTHTYTSTHTGPLLEEFKAWRENKPVLGLESELQCMLNCVFTFFVFPSWAVDQYRHFLNAGSTVQGQTYILWPYEGGKKTNMEKIFPYPALTCFCHVWDRHGEWQLLSWVRVCCTVCDSGGESCKSGGKRSHVCMITFSYILFFHSLKAELWEQSSSILFSDGSRCWHPLWQLVSGTGQLIL